MLGEQPHCPFPPRALVTRACRGRPVSRDRQTACLTRQLQGLVNKGNALIETRHWHWQRVRRREQTLLESRFSPDGRLLVAADEIGGFLLVNPRRTRCMRCEGPLVKQSEAHRAAIFGLAWTHDSRRLATAGGDQVTRLWDLETLTVEELTGHTASIKCVAQSATDPDVFLTGARDGRALLFDLRLGARQKNVAGWDAHRPFITMCHDASAEEKWKRKRQQSYGVPRSVTNVAFLPNRNHILTTGSDGQMRFWDVRYLRAHRNKASGKGVSKPMSFMTIDHTHSEDDASQRGPNGSPVLRREKAINTLSVSPDGTTLLVGVTNSVLYTHDAYGPDYRQLDKMYCGHNNRSFYIKTRYSPDGRYIMSGSDDGAAYMWEAGGDYWPVLKLEGHWGDVNDIDMNSQDPFLMATVGDEPVLRLWTPESEAIQSTDCSCGWTAGRQTAAQPGRVTVHRRQCGGTTAAGGVGVAAATAAVAAGGGGLGSTGSNDRTVLHERATMGLTGRWDEQSQDEEINTSPGGTSGAETPPRPTIKRRQSTLAELWGTGGQSQEQMDISK